MSKMDEIVYAIKITDLFSDDKYFNGYKTPADPVILDRIYTKNIEMTRGECEENPEFKHIIPYCILTNTNGQIFVVRRTANQTEERLHDKASVGIGGHVGPAEFRTPKDSIHAGMLRELKEEVTGMDNLEETVGFTPILAGFVNYDYDAVGRVHFGLVYNLLVNLEQTKAISVKETKNMYGDWTPIKEALLLKNYESWSQCIIEEFFKRGKEEWAK